MPTMADVVTGVRQKVRDFARVFQSTVQGDGLTQIFELPVIMIEPTSLQVIHLSNGATPQVTMVANTDYTLDAHHGDILLLTGNLPVGDTLNIFGTHYQWFLDEDIQTEAAWWIQAMEDNQADPYYFDDIPTTSDPRFELTVRGALLGCLWSLLIEASFDIDVRNPEGVDIPTSQRFAQINQLIQVWTERYHELADRLNIGIDRIEILTLRRNSLSTGRLVPIYKEMEFDDQATPQRIYPLIDSDQGMYDPPPPPTIPPSPGPFII